ncbi:DUF1127 domain-containing protein [Dongia sp.]|uniref:DUF1127 domain-containing protein n=1 Tax=Dongia sp. TaxID=1977262 RepID=UPI00375332EE
MGVQQMPAPRLTASRHAAAAFRAAAAFAAWWQRTGDTLLIWLERYRQRRALVAMSDHMLKDLGLSRSDAGREGGKRFWEG